MNILKPLYTVAIVLSITLLSNCSTSGNKEAGVAETPISEDPNLNKHEFENDVTSTDAGKPQFTVGEVFQGQISSVFTSYIDLKEAFVSSDVSKVKKEADATLEALTKVDMNILTGAAHNDWMNYERAMKTSLNDIKASDDLEAQRTAFSKLTDNLYKTIKAYGLGGTATAYYEFCPMAFNDKGGYWLSDNEKIRNPYFGDKMLTCGSVKEKLQ